MKKNFLMIAIAALALTACGKTQKAVAETENATVEAETQDAAQSVTNINEVLGEATGSVVDLTNDEAFRPGVKVETLTVLDFNATWCGPCKMLHPVFEAAAKTFAGKVRFVSVDIDNLPETAAAYDVQAVPTVVLIRPDGTTKRYVGTQELLPAENFDKIISENL